MTMKVARIMSRIWKEARPTMVLIPNLRMIMTMTNALADLSTRISITILVIASYLAMMMRIYQMLRCPLFTPTTPTTLALLLALILAYFLALLLALL